jgi:hypothetical protein
MSDEGRDYVKTFSPYRGQTFWLHYVLGDWANAQHDYMLWMSDRTIIREWPVFNRGTLTRSRQELLKGGHLTPIDVGGGPGKPRTYRFEFLGAEHMRKEVRNPRAQRAGSRALVNSTRAKGARVPARSVVPGVLGTEVGTEETEEPVFDHEEFARVRQLLGGCRNEEAAS